MSSGETSGAAGQAAQAQDIAAVLAQALAISGAGRSQEQPAEQRRPGAKLASLPEPREGGARRAVTVHELPRYADNPCPRPVGEEPAVCGGFDCELTRGYIAVSKGGSKGALYEYKANHCCTSFLYDTVQYLGELLAGAGDGPVDKESLLVVYTHTKAVLDHLILRADYLKLRGEEGQTRPGLVKVAEHLLEGPSTYPVTSAALLEAISTYKDYEIKSALRSGGAAGTGAAPPGGGGYTRYSSRAPTSGRGGRGPGGQGGRGGGSEPRGQGPAYNTRSRSSGAPGGATASTGE